MINQSKPTPSLTNSTKVSFGETWATILTTWSSETRTWLATGSLLVNATRNSSTMTNSNKPS